MLILRSWFCDFDDPENIAPRAKKRTIEFDVESIHQGFAELPDPRSHMNRRHLLGDIIVLNVIAIDD
ncbi:hypothetical protein [Neorhodopirellula lusitana]|uniref:hypothetical protein n=1 Tax=Neorhodopirellula lusitana TaxID=445327 RepID=UPI00384F6F7D